MQQLSKDSGKYRATLKEGVEHFELCVKLAKAQRAEGRYFFFENPWGAWSWRLAVAREAMDLYGMRAVKGHQCAYHQTSMDPDGWKRLPKIPTGWMTNSPCMASALAKRCANERLPEEQHHRTSGMLR